MFFKKGVVEVQFNWVFVLIAGAVILMFFVNFAMDYRESGETEIATQVLQELGSLASSSLQASGTAQDVEFGGLDLEVNCDPATCSESGCDQQFDLGGRGISAPEWMELEPIFSSRNIESDHLLLWTLPWQAPFHVTNFLYLTDPENRFIFVCQSEGECGFVGRVYSKFSENVYANHDYIYLDDINDTQYEGERQNNFVMFMDHNEFDGFGGIEDDRVKERINVLFVDPDESSVDYGEVFFGSVDDEGEVSVDNEGSPYIGKPMLIGAVFSDLKSDYECNVRKSMLKFSNVNDIYKEKSEQLFEGCSESGSDCNDCEDYYGSDGTKEYIDDMDFDIDDINDLEIEKFHNNIEGLADLNNEAYRRGCPRVY
ncbi:MAG: hypothetical protein ACOCQG_01690 [Candidatus Nanoarchaeia archaeon]